MAKSVKQKINVKSSTEAELVGVSDILPHIVWMRNFVRSQGYRSDNQAVLYQDNQSTMRLIDSGRPLSARTRHLHIRYFFVTDRIKSGELTMKYIKTDEMLADFLTKPLQGELFAKLRDKLMNVVSKKKLGEERKNDP